MHRNSVILRSIDYLLLLVLSYNYFCSAICSFSKDGCCGKETIALHYNCCGSHDNDSGESKDDCQNNHLSFFKTLGQFGSGQNIDAPKVFETSIGALDPIFLLEPISTDNILFESNGFHPPPPEADIRIFIQSFQI